MWANLNAANSKTAQCQLLSSSLATHQNAAKPDLEEDTAAEWDVMRIQRQHHGFNEISSTALYMSSQHAQTKINTHRLNQLNVVATSAWLH